MKYETFGVLLVSERIEGFFVDSCDASPRGEQDMDCGGDVAIFSTTFRLSKGNSSKPQSGISPSYCDGAATHYLADVPLPRTTRRRYVQDT